ncbi:MAG: VCBS repeat-containing protein, partial [Flavobacteriales bacterium]
MKVAPLLTLILLGNTLGAQVFTEVPPALLPFAGVYYSASAFADVDGDGDQDLLITGKNEQDTLVAELYTNDGSGGFTLVLGTPFTGVYFGAASFADIDGDGDQDVLIAGSLETASAFETESFIGMYTNDGAGNFTLLNGTPFIGVGRCTINFEDVDGDGDQDVL